MPCLHLRLLGGFKAQIAPGQPLEIPTRKTRALLAFLALPTGRAHSRDELANLLWGDRADEQARNSLRQAIAELGRSLAGVEPSPLAKGPDTLELDPQAVEVDALIFERLARSSDLHNLRAGTRMYDGELLAGFAVREAAFEEWLRHERQRLHELAISALRRLLARESGEHALATAQCLLALDALQEEGHRRP